MYDRTRISPIGQITLHVSQGHRRVEATFIVVRRGCRLLIGRDLMEKLGYQITQINAIEADKDLQRILEKYKQLFDGKIGCYKYGKIEIKTKDNVQPIFCRPRPVPLAFKKEVTRQLEEFEKRGIIVPVDDNSWGTPLVPILKPEGGLRI